jgi:phosphoribosyl 1,2-cyclic phosphodiesterase
MRARIWGSRGSIAAPGPETIRYGGNTSCVEVRTDAGGLLIIDAGTGLRPLGVELQRDPPARIDLLLSHLHVDHLEGLGAFLPIWSPDTELHIWGPSSPVHSLDERIAIYFSPPLFPVHLSDVPATVIFHDAPEHEEVELAGALVSSQPIRHQGPTVGYRIEEAGRILAYLTDHEPALGTDLATVGSDWISGHALAFGADVLIHDAQYTEEEYEQRVGWGHSSTAHVALFAQRAKVDRLLLFHHDPMHTDDDLDRVRDRVRELWDVPPDRCEPAAEGMTFEV